MLEKALEGSKKYWAWVFFLGIFALIGTTDKTVVEIAAGDGELLLERRDLGLIAALCGHDASRGAVSGG